MEAEAHKLTASTPIGDNYELLFQKLVKRNAIYLLTQIEQVETPFSSETRLQIMDVLGYGFGFEDLQALCAQLTLTATLKIEQAGFRNEWIPFLQQAIAVPLSVEQLCIKAELYYYLGFLYQLQSRYEDARHCLIASISSFSTSGDPVGEAKALNRLAFVERLCDRPKEAEEYVLRAFEILTPEHPSHEFTYFNLAVLAEERGDYGLAVSHYEQSLALAQKLNNPSRYALRLGNLGLGLYYAKQFERAIDCFERSIRVFLEQLDRFRTATMQNNLGIVYLVQGKYENAIHLFEAAEETFRAVHDHHYLGLVYLNLGIAHRHLKLFDRSKLFLTNSTVYWQSIGSTAQLANTLDELGLTHIAAGEYTNAKECFDSALHELNMGKATLELQRIRQRVDIHITELQTLYLRKSD